MSEAAGRREARAWSEPRQAPNQSSPWFSDLKSKLTTFNMSEWLNSLGIGNKKNNGEEGDLNEFYDDTPATPTLERSNSMSPIPALLTPTANINSPNQQSESFELPNFWLNLEPGRNYKDTLELQHFGPLKDLKPLGKHGLGKGHDFLTIQLSNPTWCDKCGDFIWGFYKQAVMCSTCKYTCHYKCRMLVTLDCSCTQNSLRSTCSGASFMSAHSALPNLYPETYNDSNVQIEDKHDEFNDQLTEITSVDEEGFDLEPDLVLDAQVPNDLQTLNEAVHQFNSIAGNNRKMTVDPNTCSFSGYIPVHLNFTRPINVVSGQRPASIYDVIPSEDTYRSDTKTIQSFYLPRNTMKTLHISSDTTTREMIVVLLRKFRVADNPRKFALYERDYDSVSTLKAKLRRVSEDACPLRLALSWGSQTTKRFVLQENDAGEILWDAFEIPELNNFLRFLGIEEENYVWQIKQKYSLLKYYLELEIREKGGKLPNSQSFPELPEADSTKLRNTNPFEDDVHEVKMDVADGADVFANDHDHTTQTINNKEKNNGSENSGSWHYYGTL